MRSNPNRLVAPMPSQSQMQTDNNDAISTASTKSRVMSVDNDFSNKDNTSNKSPLHVPDATNDLFCSNLQQLKKSNDNKTSNNNNQADTKNFFQKVKPFISNGTDKNNDNTNKIQNCDNERNVSVSEDSISYNDQSPCPFGCKHCGASFDHIVALKNHLLNGHCRQERQEESKANLSVSSSTNEPATSTVDRKKRFQCLLCERGFEYRWILKRHMKVHTGEKEFPCEICGKKFRHKSNVKVHMIKHSNAAKITCDQCGKQFKWKASYKRHKCFQK